MVQLIKTLARVTFQEIINYIQANLNETITLEELATLASLSPRHFSRKFKLHTQMSPNQYVIRCRVETAELLLLHTDIPIADIAILVGFHSQSHLNRHFKRILKVTPKILRQNKQETPKNKKIVNKDSWKWLTNWSWIFFPKSFFESRVNPKNKSRNNYFVKHDFDLYQQIQGDLKNNNLNFISDIITPLILHYFIFFVYQHDLKNQQFNFRKIGTNNHVKNNQLNLNSFIYNQDNIKYGKHLILDNPSSNLTKILGLQPIIENVIGKNEILQKYVQNVEDKLLAIFLGYEHSNISATLFNFKENMTMKINPVSRVNNQSIENDQLSNGEVSPDIIKERLEEKISNGEVSPDLIKERFEDIISNEEFSPDLIKEKFEDIISNGDLDFPIRDEFQKERNLGEFVDSFTGERSSKAFDSFTGADIETPFDPLFPGEFSPKDRSNLDLTEFGNLELPESGYGIASELELPNNIELGDFNFNKQLSFLNNSVLDELGNLADVE